METSPANTVHILTYPLEERAGAGRCTLQPAHLTLANMAGFLALPAHVRTAVRQALVNGNPCFKVCSDGAMNQQYAVVTQVCSTGTTDNVIDVGGRSSSRSTPDFHSIHRTGFGDY